ncbi:hypothetical protein NPIL_441541, partial [Nephila pilipes]
MRLPKAEWDKADCLKGISGSGKTLELGTSRTPSRVSSISCWLEFTPP